MTEENNEQSDEKPSLADTIYISVGAPGINAEISMLFDLYTETLVALRKSGTISNEQIEEIINHASEHAISTRQRLTESGTSVPKRMAEATAQMEEETNKRLEKLRERLGE